VSAEWLLGIGYVRLWERVHRGEEALIMVQPTERVIADALGDQLRLQGSSIDNRDELLLRVRTAVDVLCARAGVILRASTPAGPPAPAAPPPAYTVADEQLALETLRGVRRAIDEFRDECRLGLVRARNQLFRTVLGTAIVAYLLLALAIGVSVPRYTLIAATSFFLVGAVVGLFNRLYLDASTQTAVEDYGLSFARLVHTPLFSGLAALGGVLVIPMLSVLVNPVGAASQPDTTNAIVAPALADIFDVVKRPFGLVIAAIFGLSPATLISRLQQEADQYKTGLKSSEEQARQRAQS
jgi:hypothetical protein